MNWIRNNLLREFPPDGRYLVGVSGGRDSVALLHSLVDCDYKKMIVCHLNHQLRRRASDADARFVEKLSSKYDVRVVIESLDVRALAKRKKLSIETAAREARYEFFAQVAKQMNFPTIFLGHHADDVVETFLINLFRGSGTSGLASIREVSTRCFGEFDLKIVRPLVQVWRADIDRYVRGHRLNFRDDASNKDLAPLRNRIRHRVIPYLEKAVGRTVRQSIWRAAMIASEEQAWFETQMSHSVDTELAVEQLRDQPVALQRRQVLSWLRQQNISNVGFDVVESVRALLDHNSGAAKINLPRDRHVRRRAKKIFVE